MIRRNSFNNQLIEQKPRKKINIDVINDKSYNQFQGNSDIDIKDLKDQENTRHNDFYDFQNKNHRTSKDQVNIEQQISQYSKIFSLVSKEGLKFKKIDQKNKQNQKDNSKNQKDDENKKSSNIKVQQNQLKKQQQISIPKVKFEEGQQEIEELKVQKQQKQNSKVEKANTPKVKTVQQPSSNWKKFMQQSTTTNNSKSQPGSVPSKFVAIDCQFVKCGQSEELARISLISEHGQTLYDSYIKPPQRVTDYITDITGITFSHLKNAPSWQQEVSKVKKILMNKILVGHTLHKDLQVCKLTDWKGISQKIDIAQFSLYREKNGSKIVSLKRMSLSFLNRNIQSGWHSSVQDATVTMDLFKLNKKKMLKEFKII